MYNVIIIHTSICSDTPFIFMIRGGKFLVPIARKKDKFVTVLCTNLVIVSDVKL